MPATSVAAIYFFFFNDTATTEIYTLSRHDALPITRPARWSRRAISSSPPHSLSSPPKRSEEHTSELQSRENLVCCLLLEKKKNNCKLRLCPCNDRNDVDTASKSSR